MCICKPMCVCKWLCVYVSRCVYVNRYVYVSGCVYVSEREEREEDGTGREGMHSKRVPTHRRVVGKMKDSGGREG